MGNSCVCGLDESTSSSAFCSCALKHGNWSCLKKKIDPTQEEIDEKKMNERIAFEAKYLAYVAGKNPSSMSDILESPR